MSHGALVVRFPDGTLKYGSYCGTSDVANPTLFEHTDDAPRHHDISWPKQCDASCIGRTVEVEVYTNYGGGMTWGASACPHRLQDGEMPFGADSMYSAEWIIEPAEILQRNGDPEWLPEYWWMLGRRDPDACYVVRDVCLAHPNGCALDESGAPS